MNDIDKLKQLIDEENYPYFDDDELQSLLEDTDDIYSLAQKLCIIKSGIEEIRLGDITIPSPRKHFLTLAQQYRKNMTGVVTRADEHQIL